MVAASEQGIFVRFRLGLWPDFFPGAQFSRKPAALEQWSRQQTPDTGPGSNTVLSDAVAALFAKIGPAVHITHSASGHPVWLTQTTSDDVKALVSMSDLNNLTVADLLSRYLHEHGLDQRNSTAAA